jgi:hypothetical protein
VTEPVRLFIGSDHREAVGAHVFLQSLIERSSVPVSVTVISEKVSSNLGVGTDGSNAFSKSRFLVPYLSGFSGYSLWVDGDMLMRGDIAELWAMREGWYAAQVVKHDYTPTSRKYIGSEMESENDAYPKKNWSSVVLWNSGYFGNRCLTPEYISKESGQFLHRFEWLCDDRLGALPPEWNWLVGEMPYNIGAKLVHFTLGIPGFSHYANCHYAVEWRAACMRSMRGLQYDIRLWSGR